MPTLTTKPSVASTSITDIVGTWRKQPDEVQADRYIYPNELFNSLQLYENLWRYKSRGESHVSVYFVALKKQWWRESMTWASRTCTYKQWLITRVLRGIYKNDDDSSDCSRAEVTDGWVVRAGVSVTWNEVTDGRVVRAGFLVTW